MALTTVHGEERGASTSQAPKSNFANSRAEFHSLLANCGIYTLTSRAKIEVRGGDRTRWLNGMVSNNIRDLALNRGTYAFLLNPQGRIQADLYAYNLGESLVVDTDVAQRETVLTLFDKYIIADDVEISDISAELTAIGVAGPQAESVLRKAGIQAPDLAPLELCTPTCDCACGCVQCTVVRTDDPAGDAFEIWLSPDKFQLIWDALVAAGATPVSANSVEFRRISQGIPRFGIDIRDRDLPQETGQSRALSFTKGCYIGQEIVERIRSRGAVHRLFTAFSVEGALPEPGTKITAAENSSEKEVGEITSSAILPFPAGNRPIVLGYLRREANRKELHAGPSLVKPVSLPIT